MGQFKNRIKAKTCRMTARVYDLLANEICEDLGPAKGAIVAMLLAIPAWCAAFAVLWVFLRLLGWW